VTTGERPRLSVIIPTYNGRKLLESCLPSLARFAPRNGLEVIVADDASTDGTAEWLLENHPKVQIVRLGKNGGFVAAANAGIAAARGEFIQLLNNDAEVTSGWFEEALKPFSDPTVGSVAPLVLLRADPSRVDSAGDSYHFVGWPSKRGHGEAAAKWLQMPSDRVFGASGSSAIYRAEALRKVGAYDPAFGSYYEDIDLAFRLRWAGFACVFTSSCVILHDISATYNHARPELQRRMSRNAEYLFWADLPWSRLIPAILPHLGFVLAQGMWRLCRGRAKPFWLGKLDALRAISWFRGRRAQLALLAESPISRPHFPLERSGLTAARNHVRRPKETSGRIA
jgi:GT2 family glycosyltransferase